VSNEPIVDREIPESPIFFEVAAVPPLLYGVNNDFIMSENQNIF
jgi:hypothetical protein